MALPFPNIDPIAFKVGPIEIRWYGISYVVGILLAWLYCRHLIRRYSSKITLKDIDDFIVWATIGVVLGGRLGWVMFYMPEGYFEHFWEVFFLWKPGMSFHGGLVGVIIVGYIFSYIRQLPKLLFGDLLAAAAPIGLFFGRIANFINAELYGRTTDVAWGVVFPTGGPLPRHPSQLYEAALEGIILFLILFICEHFLKIRQRYPGFMFGLFFIGYGLARVIVELYREPDEHIGFLLFGTTMGQLLSLPIILAGMIILGYAIINGRSLNK